MKLAGVVSRDAARKAAVHSKRRNFSYADVRVADKDETALAVLALVAGDAR
jgi:hypothetical protein